MEGLVTYDFTLHLRIHDHTTWIWRCVGIGFGHFLLGSQNFMVTALGSCMKWPLGNLLNPNYQSESIQVITKVSTWLDLVSLGAYTTCNKQQRYKFWYHRNCINCSTSGKAGLTTFSIANKTNLRSNCWRRIERQEQMKLKDWSPLIATSSLISTIWYDHTLFNNHVVVYHQSSLFKANKDVLHRRMSQLYIWDCGHVATEAMDNEWSNWLLFSWESTLLADYKVGETTTERNFGSWRDSRWPNLVRFLPTKWEKLWLQRPEPLQLRIWKY